MAKVVFFNVPAHGHINPTLPLVTELVNRGEKVIYYATEEFKPKIQKTGAIFRSYQDQFEYKITGVNENLFNLAAMLMETCRTFMPQLLDEVKKEKPDYVIHDAVCLWGKYIAQIMDLPAVSSVTTLAFNWRSVIGDPSFIIRTTGMFPTGIYGLIRYITALRSVTKKYQISKRNIALSFLDTFMSQEELNIIYTSRAFQPFSASFSDSFKFVGPSISSRHDELNFPLGLLDKGQTIYISLGTIFNEQIDFYVKCFEAFANINDQIVLSVGNKIDISRLKPFPDNFIIRNYVPQLDILQRSRLFITHGGINSVSEGLYYNVPLIVIPQTAEQQVVANRVESLGAGICLNKSRIIPQTLRDRAEKILSETKFLYQSKVIGDSLRSAGGYKRAADEILLLTAA